MTWRALCRFCSPRHQNILDPRSLSQTASYDVASLVCLAQSEGPASLLGGRRQRGNVQPLPGLEVQLQTGGEVDGGTATGGERDAKGRV